MTEHEKLKAICDEIGYDHWLYDFDNGFFVKSHIEVDVTHQIKIDVREIVFTPSFMEKFNNYRLNLIGHTKVHTAVIEPWKLILDKLADPVDYLYNLLELGST